MKKPSAILWALALALALAGFAPLGWAQDATMTDTESGSYTEGDATAVALTFAVSGEVPQFAKGIHFGFNLICSLLQAFEPDLIDLGHAPLHLLHALHHPLHVRLARGCLGKHRRGHGKEQPRHLDRLYGDAALHHKNPR